MKRLQIYIIFLMIKIRSFQYTDVIEYDEEKLDRLIYRLDKIKTLEKKYSKPLNELIVFTETIKEELDELENYEETLKLSRRSKKSKKN